MLNFYGPPVLVDQAEWMPDWGATALAQRYPELVRVQVWQVRTSDEQTGYRLLDEGMTVGEDRDRTALAATLKRLAAYRRRLHAP